MMHGGCRSPVKSAANPFKVFAKYVDAIVGETIKIIWVRMVWKNEGYVNVNDAARFENSMNFLDDALGMANMFKDANGANKVHAIVRNHVEVMGICDQIDPWSFLNIDANYFRTGRGASKGIGATGFFGAYVEYKRIGGKEVVRVRRNDPK
jgi:hypothetical protein